MCKIVFSVFLLIACSLVSIGAESKDPPSNLTTALKLAEDQQFEFKNEEAVLTLTEALDRFAKNNQPTLEDLNQLADVYLFMALCHKNLGNMDLMKSNLKEAARLNPSLYPDERTFPPSLLTQFEASKDKIWNEGHFSSLMIESTPSNASVFLNGSFKGKTPIKINRQPEGNHYLYVIFENKEAFKKIELAEGKSEKINIKLVRKK